MDGFQRRDPNDVGDLAVAHCLLGCAVMKLRGLLVSLFIPAALSGCVTETADGGENTGVSRGPLGKADIAGSCATDDGEALCGGPSNGTCWCDDKCHEYGDCCEDKVDVCGGDNPDPGGPSLCMSTDQCGEGEVCDHSVCHSNCSPGLVCPAVCFGECVPGSTGGQVGDPCSLFGDQCEEGLVCEFVCPFDADPCPNFGINPSGFCAEPAEPPPPPVKCNAELPCDDDEYCHWDANEGCGADGGSGVCTPKPEACIEIFSPVCGCDGEVYGNGCEANANGLSWVPAAQSNEGFICPGSEPEPEPEATCEGNCGSHADGKVCYCDDLCEQYGDCCDDYQAACAA